MLRINYLVFYNKEMREYCLSTNSNSRQQEILGKIADGFSGSRWGRTRGLRRCLRDHLPGRVHARAQGCNRLLTTSDCVKDGLPFGFDDMVVLSDALTPMLATRLKPRRVGYSRASDALTKRHGHTGHQPYFTGLQLNATMRTHS